MDYISNLYVSDTSNQISDVDPRLCLINLCAVHGNYFINLS